MQVDLNVENVTLALVGLQVVWGAIKEIVLRTPSKKDDRVLQNIQENISNRISQIRQRAPYFWALVEAMEQTGILPDKAAKPVAFMKKLQQAFGALSADEEKTAREIAEKLSAESKELPR